MKLPGGKALTRKALRATEYWDLEWHGYTKELEGKLPQRIRELYAARQISHRTYTKSLKQIQSVLEECFRELSKEWPF